MAKAKSNGKPRAQHPSIENEKFVTVWQNAATVDEAAETLGLARAITASRAYNLRKRGVNLKKMGGRGQAIDVDSLNKLIAKL